jgi:hypothetical protein
MVGQGAGTAEVWQHSGTIAQIKVAPTVKDLQALQTAVTLAKLNGRWRQVDEALDDNLALLSAPRLHRAP